MRRLAIVIPTRGRPDRLARTLDRLGGQRPGLAEQGAEVLVVTEDDASEVAAAERAIGERAFAVRCLARRAPSVAAARNAGWRASDASLILFLGDDILADPQLVAEHLGLHARQPDRRVGVLGAVRWAPDLRVTPFMRWLERGLQFDYRGIRGEDAGWGRFYTANVSVKRALVEDVGGFDESFEFSYEDTELAYRLSREGLRLLYAPAASAEHLHPTTVADWRVRMRAVAAGERRMVAKHPDFTPYFHDRFIRAVAKPPARGRGARLAHVVPRTMPGLGPRVWASAEGRWEQELAHAFLAAWQAQAATQSSWGRSAARGLQ